MLSVNGAKQVINLFVRNSGESLITKPKTIQIFVDDIATKLKYLPPLEGDAMTLSSQAKKVAKRISDLKSRVLDVNGEKITYKEFFSSKNLESFSEDRKLCDWYSLLRCNSLDQNEMRCLEEINKCFQIENISKIEFFKNLTKEEKELLQQLGDKAQLISVITGHKPAYYGGVKGVVNFQNAIKDTKYVDNFIAINSKAVPTCFTIVNKTRLKEIIENNKEVYCRELGLEINTPTKEVYNKWLYCLEHECPTAEKPFAFGLMLGYPKWSSLIYSLERRNFMEDNNELLKLLQKEYLINNQKTQEIIMKAIRHENSPLSNYSEEFKRDFEHYVRTEDFRKFMRPDGGDFYYQCTIYGSESAHMEKVLKEEADFINNFRMEQLFS